MYCVYEAMLAPFLSVVRDLRISVTSAPTLTLSPGLAIVVQVSRAAEHIHHFTGDKGVTPRYYPNQSCLRPIQGLRCS